MDLIFSTFLNIGISNMPDLKRKNKFLENTSR